MNIAIGILVGGIVGWAGYSYLKFNASRGLIISIVIGMAAGFLGGEVIAPMLGAAAVTAGDFNPLSVFVAFASSAACLIIGNMVYNRFGV